MSFYKHKSGAQKRDAAASTERFISKLPKLDNFFSTNISDPQPHTITLQAVDDLSQLLPIDEGHNISARHEASFPPLEVAPVPANLYDPSTWHELLNTTPKMLEQLIRLGPAPAHNRATSYPASKRAYNDGESRYFQNNMLIVNLANGERGKRDWLCYSPLEGKVYCFQCTIMCAGSNESNAFVQGFNDWRHFDRIKCHENSLYHRRCTLDLITRSSQHGRVDSDLDISLESERAYWSQVLKRVIAVIKFLGSNGLAFRGGDERFESNASGNYINTLKLLAKFDAFIAGHIAKYADKGRGSVSYLSSTIADEFISVIAKKITEMIVDEVVKAKYYSISVDSSPDVSHVDQLVVVIRYVHPNRHVCVERFLTFIPIFSHTGVSLADVTLGLFQRLGIDLGGMRGQCYDNAANMSGKYNGMQKKILEQAPLAMYLPCAPHSLNLVGQAAVSSVDRATMFFAFVQDLYTFFAASTHRWKVLTDYLEDNLVPKNLADTRWSAHAQATRALKEAYDLVDEALQEIANDSHQKPSTRHEAGNLSATMSIWDTPILTELWNRILHRFNIVSKCLQGAALDLSETSHLLDSLVEYFKSLRDCFIEIESAANHISKKERQEPSRGSRRHQHHFLPDGQLTASTSKMDSFRINVFLPIIDLIIVELTRRTEVYKKVYSLFGFLIDLSATAPKEEVVEKVRQLISNYPEDFKDSDEISEEVVHYRILMSVVPSEQLRINHTSGNLSDDGRIHFAGIYIYLRSHNIDSVFPNVTIALRICLTLMCTVATDERCFSYMKRVKNVLRTTMSQGRFADLATMTIERELLDEIDDKEIISSFVEQKIRKKSII